LLPFSFSLFPFSLPLASPSGPVRLRLCPVPPCASFRARKGLPKIFRPNATAGSARSHALDMSENPVVTPLNRLFKKLFEDNLRLITTGTREEAVPGRGESSLSLRREPLFRTRRFPASPRARGGPAWAETSAEPPTRGRGREDWNSGTMEYWNNGLGDQPPSPAFHHSTIPS